MSFRAGPRLGPALLGAAAVAAGGALWSPLAFAALGLALGLLAWALLEALRLRRVKPGAARQAVAAISLGERETLEVTLWHDGADPLQLSLRARLPDLLGGGSRHAAARCGAGERTLLRFEVTGVSRGEAPLPPLDLGLTRFGLVERICAVAAPQTVRVLPNLRAVGRLHQKLNDLFLRGLGTRMAPRIGQGREFDRMRDYVAGDDPRHLAWKASARQGKLIVREFRVERSQDVLVCVDRGHRMAGRVGTLSRADHAVNAAALLAYVCNRTEDRFGLLSFAAEVDRGVAQGRGPTHLSALTRFATGIAPGYLPTDYRALAAHLQARLRARTLVLLMTALPERNEHGELLAAVRALTPRHLPLVLVLKDAGLEAAAAALPRDREELSRALVASELVQGRAQLVRELRQLGALVAETLPEQSPETAVNAYLDVKRRQLL